MAIVVVCYNRLDAFKFLISSLLNSHYDDAKIDLMISIDKSETDDIERFARSINWPFGVFSIIARSENLGLRRHILECGELLRKYDALIVLEDDLFVSPGFYLFAKQTVDKYYNDNRVAGISLYSFRTNFHTRMPFVPQETGDDVFFMNCAQSWGQVWMKNQWNDFFHWYKSNDSEFALESHLPCSLSKWPETSWLKYHTRYCIENDKYFIYPYVSFATNRGVRGVHSTGKSTLFQVPLLYGIKTHFNLPLLDEDSIIYDGFFERKGLGRYMEIDEKDLCVDFYGSKTNVNRYKYWLTTKRSELKILKSYALSFKPYEMNVIYNNIGNDLYLYEIDTGRYNRSVTRNSIKSVKYLFNIPLFTLFLKCIGLIAFIRESFIEIFQKVRKQI